MTWIKICGITRREDAKLAIDLGADAIGLVFVRSSPRFCANAMAFRDLPVQRVGVFADAPFEDVKDLSNRAALDFVQLHGQETPEYCARIDRPVVKAFRGSIAAADAYRAFAVLADSPRSGATFDWSALPAIASRLIVAGGLTANNVKRAIAIARPFGVDVSSGVESSPGIKDKTAMRHFVGAVRDHDHR